MDDRNLLKLIDMAGQAEALERGDTARGDDRVLARLTPAAPEPGLNEAEIEVLVRGRLARMPRPERSQAWRASAAAVLAAVICGSVMLWPLYFAKQQSPAPVGPVAKNNQRPESATPAIAEVGPEASGKIDAGADASRSASARMARSDAAPPSDFAKPLAMASKPASVRDAATVFVVLRDQDRCGCERLEPETFAGRVSDADARVVYARSDTAESQPLNASDFACFQTHFARRGAAAKCDNATVAPALSISDFLCFTSKLSAGCM